MVQEVRSSLFDELFRINKHRVLGSSRKLLGLSFEGETRDADEKIRAILHSKTTDSGTFVVVRPDDVYYRVMFLNLSFCILLTCRVACLCTLVEPPFSDRRAPIVTDANVDLAFETGDVHARCERA